MLAATTRGACSALSQCSTRSRRPYRAEAKAAQSPAAYTPAADARSRPPPATPLPSPTGEPASQATCGLTPTATTVKSADSQPPPGSTSPSASTDSTGWPSRRSAPASAYHGTVTDPTSGPSAPASGLAAASTTVTWQPRSRAVVAGSAPIHPAPTTPSPAPGQRAPRRRRPRERRGIVEGAQDPPPANSRQAHRDGPGGQHQGVEGVLPPVGQEHSPVQGGGCLTQPEVQPECRRVGRQGG